ncbi:hypothetical protein ACFWRT_13170 [Streptomyces cyaneofuscatus]|uniref:hypothetical protein n=1 Tax=Streptomyces cyaneofuscatus TaxID=66883 RepID=UPI00364D908E
MQALLTYHSDYTHGRMELEVRRVSYEGEGPGGYEEIEGGDIFHETLATPSGTSVSALEAGKAEVVERPARPRPVPVGRQVARGRRLRDLQRHQAPH